MPYEQPKQCHRRKYPRKIRRCAPGLREARSQHRFAYRIDCAQMLIFETHLARELAQIGLSHL